MANEWVANIEAELRRLSASAGQNNVEPLVVTATAGLPLGWVEVGDTVDAAYYGPAADVLAALRGVPTPKEGDLDPEGFAAGWEAAHDALAVRFRTDPRGHKEWPDELCGVEQVEDGGLNDNPLHVAWVDTNAGRRWACGPDGVDENVFTEAHRYGLWYATREEAMASSGA